MVSYSSHVFDTHTVWSIPLIWSNPPGCEQRAQWSIQLLLPVKYWTYIHNTADLHITHIQYNTPHLYWVTPLCIFNRFVGNVWRTHPIIHMPAFTNFTAEGPQKRVRESEIYSMKGNKRYFIYTILAFGLIPSSLIHSVSFKRKDQQGSMCGHCWDCCDWQWCHGNSILPCFPLSLKCAQILTVQRVQVRTQIHIFTNTYELSWTWNYMRNIIAVRNMRYLSMSSNKASKAF